MSLRAPRTSVRLADGGLARSGATPPRAPLALLAICSAGDYEPTPYRSKSLLKTERGYGPGVDAAGYALTNEVDELLFLRVTTADGTAGAYGSITQTWDDGSAPSVAADSVVLPADDLEPVITFGNDGEIGVDGLTYTYSLDAERKVSGLRKLGTDMSITLPYGGGKYVFTIPDESALIAAVVEARAEFIDHIALTAGSVHGAADTTSDDALPGAPATVAAAITCMAAVIAGAKLHVVMTASLVHAGQDAAALVALNAIVTPTDAASCAIAFNAYKAAMNAHLINVDSVHGGSGDATNTIDHATVKTGVVTAGDSFSLVTTAPRWSIDALVAAIVQLQKSSKPWSDIGIVGPILTSGECEAIQAALDDCADAMHYPVAIGHFRHKTAAETIVQYGAAFDAGPGQTSTCPSVFVTWPMMVPCSINNVGAQYYRFLSWSGAPRCVAADEATNPTSRDEWGAMVGAVRGSDGKVLPRGVDEGETEVGTPLRAWAPGRRPEFPDEVLSSQGASLASEDSDFQILPRRRVGLMAVRLARKEYARIIGKKLLPGKGGVIDADERKGIDATVEEVLANLMVRTGQAVSVTPRLDPMAIITGNPPILVRFTVEVGVFGYIDKLDGTVSLKGG